MSIEAVSGERVFTVTSLPAGFIAVPKREWEEMRRQIRLKDVGSPESRAALSTLDHLLMVAAQVCGVTEAQIRGRQRMPDVIDARYLTWHILHTLHHWTQSQIAAAFSRDVSSVSYGLSTVADRLKRDPKTCTRFMQIESRLPAKAS